MLRTGDSERLKVIAANKEASKPVLTDLAQAGFNVDWIEDLYTKRFNYKEAIPILLRWLPVVENRAVKESIVRTLSVKWAQNTTAPELLIVEFRKAASDDLLQWAIGNALSVVADDRVLDDIIELVENKAYGIARQMLAISLGNMKSPKAVSVLIELLNDPDVDGHAIMALGKLKSKEARSEIERFITHPNTWIRKEAKKALAKIDK
jgi:hypothetical protein